MGKAKAINNVTLIGNVVKKPDLRQTKTGISVCTFHLITDRVWNDRNGVEKKESMKHVVVAWDRLAEICYNLLNRGSFVYVFGRLENHIVRDQDGYERLETSVVISEMIKLDSHGDAEEGVYPEVNLIDGIEIKENTNEQ